MYEGLADLPFRQVLTAPTAPGGESPLRHSILAGLLDAGVQQLPVASLWIRPEPDSYLEVFVGGGGGGQHWSDEPDDWGDPLAFPLGATGRQVERKEFMGRLNRFGSWVSCNGSFEPLLEAGADQQGSPEGRWSATPLDDVVGYLTHRCFAWLAFCTPVARKVVEDELDGLRRELFRLRQSSRLSEAEVLDLERGQAWFREIERSGVGAVWDVSIAVGAPDGQSAFVAAAMLCSAAERSSLSYRIRPSANGCVSSAMDAVLAVDPPEGRRRDRSPFRATAELAAALVRPPETELPGIRLVIPPSFDTTPELRGLGDSMEVGSVLDRFLRPAGPFRISSGTLNRHAFVCGATGSGKSQTTRNLLEALSRRTTRIPWLVIEPAKAEYARMAGRLKGLDGGGVLVIRPGDPDSIPGSINPLEPATLSAGNPSLTFPLQSHADLVRALFLAAFQADEPFPQVLSRALTDCYTSAGWDLVTGRPLRTWDPSSGQFLGAGPRRSLPRYPRLADLQLTARRVVDEIGYGDDVKKNVRGFVDVRIGSLRQGTPGRFFEGGHPLDFGALLKRNVVIEAEGITSDQDKAFVMGTLLIRLYEQLLLEERVRFDREGGGSPLRHVTVVEEAHRLLRNVPGDSPAAHSLELFASLLAEIRAYGEGVVIAEQIPSKLIPDVVKNTALKIVHRLPALDDRIAVGATMNLTDEQSAYVVTLTPGAAAVFADGMDRPVLARMPKSGEEREDHRLASRVPPVVEGARRSRSCGARCRDGQPCVLSTIRQAEHVLDAHPELTFWMEASVVAHVCGYAAPDLRVGPRTAQLRKLNGGDPRLVECAIAHAVEAALAPRYVALAEFYDPDALGRHLADLATAMLVSGQEPDCADDRGRWRFGRYRFADIAAQLDLIVTGKRAAAGEQQWLDTAAERGVRLAGATPKERLAFLNALPWAVYPSDQQLSVHLGDRASPAARKAAASIAGTVGMASAADKAGADGKPDLSKQLRRASDALLSWSSTTARDAVLRRMAEDPPKETR